MLINQWALWDWWDGRNVGFGLFHGSSGWENQLLTHPNQRRNRITLTQRVKMISSQDSACWSRCVWTMGFLNALTCEVSYSVVSSQLRADDLVFGVAVVPAVPWHVLWPLLWTGHSGEGLRVWAGLVGVERGCSADRCFCPSLGFPFIITI